SRRRPLFSGREPERNLGRLAPLHRHPGSGAMSEPAGGRALAVRKPGALALRPSIALALGGGGARGLAHILMLEVFDELASNPRLLPAPRSVRFPAPPMPRGIPPRRSGPTPRRS